VYYSLMHKSSSQVISYPNTSLIRYAIQTMGYICLLRIAHINQLLERFYNSILDYRRSVAGLE
jgi:hypothetical protein